MPGSCANGLVGITAGCSPKLAERLAASALAYGTASPGSAICVEPGPLFEVRTFGTRKSGTQTRPLTVPDFACHFATVFTSANFMPGVRTSCPGVARRPPYE